MLRLGIMIDLVSIAVVQGHLDLVTRAVDVLESPRILVEVESAPPGSEALHEERGEG